MKKLYIFTALLLLPLLSMARVLTADEALARVNSPVTEAARKIAQAQARLVATGTYEGEPSYYVFSNRSQAMILSANSLAVPVIGYLDAPVDEMSSMPPQLEWWLEKIGRAVAEAEAESDNAIYLPGTLQGRALPHVGIKGDSQAKVNKAARSNISALCKTKWDQDAPYNNLCPLSGSKRTYTGCVATAMAQAMKYYNYPAAGTGTVSVTFAGRTYSMTLDNTPLEWSNMLNTYTSSASASQKEAVATLMKAAGYSVKMKYGTDASGALTTDIVPALVNNFGYDQGLDYQERYYYTNEEWSEMLYNDIASGRPVLYSGIGEAGGHQFICDGYRTSDGYFHFNWGWGGAYDGMFSIDALEPEGQGIGGNGTNFNDDQSAIFGLRKPVAGSEKSIWLGVLGELTGELSGRQITLQAENGGFYNMSPWQGTFDLGFSVTNSQGKTTYHQIYSAVNLESRYGFSSLPCNIPTSYGNGVYVLAPAYRISGGVWCPIKISPNAPQSITFTIADGTISLDATDEDWDFENWKTDTGFYAGLNFNLTVTARNPNAKVQTKNLFVAIVDPSTNRIMGEYSNYIQEISIAGGGSRELTFIGNIFSDCPEGTYYCAIADADEMSMLAAARVDVQKAPEENIQVKSLAVTPSTPVIGQTFTTEIGLTNSGSSAVTVEYDLLFCQDDPDNESSLLIQGRAAAVSLTIGANTSRSYTIEDCEVSSDLEAGIYYYVVASGNKLIGYRLVELIANPGNPDGVDSIEATDAGNVRFYDLQGRAIRAQQPGAVYLRRDGQGTKKLIGR